MTRNLASQIYSTILSDINIYVSRLLGFKLGFTYKQTCIIAKTTTALLNSNKEKLSHIHTCIRKQKNRHVYVWTYVSPLVLTQRTTSNRNKRNTTKIFKHKRTTQTAFQENGENLIFIPHTCMVSYGQAIQCLSNVYFYRSVYCYPSQSRNSMYVWIENENNFVQGSTSPFFQKYLKYKNSLVLELKFSELNFCHRHPYGY